MYLAVLGAALSTYRDGSRSAGKIDVELLLERQAKLVAFQLIKQFLKGRPISHLPDRKAPALGDVRIVRIDSRPRLFTNEARNDEVFKRFPRARRRTERLEIETTHGHQSLFPVSDNR